MLSNAGTRWGTAHSDGLIRLNWRLIHFRLPVIDYVVAHELSHLRVMDHSPRFWDTVGTVVPDYAQLRAPAQGRSAGALVKAETAAPRAARRPSRPDRRAPQNGVGRSCTAG